MKILAVSGKISAPATDAAICCANRSQNGHKWPVCGLARFPKTAFGSVFRSLLGFAVILAIAPVAADQDIFLSCQITQIAAQQKEGKIDAKLKKMAKQISADESLKKYQSFKFVNKKSLEATKSRKGTVKLKNGGTLSLRAISVFRAQRKNTITVDITLAGDSGEKKFVDRNYLFLNAGEFDKKSDLILAVHCPVFP